MKLFSRKPKPAVVAKMCSACGKSLVDHAQVDIASAPVGSEEDHRLEAVINERKWIDARRYQAANAITDIRLWRMIRCGDGSVGIVAVVMPIEMWRDDYYEEPQFLSEAERDRLPMELAEFE